MPSGRHRRAGGMSRTAPVAMPEGLAVSRDRPSTDCLFALKEWSDGRQPGGCGRRRVLNCSDKRTKHCRFRRTFVGEGYERFALVTLGTGGRRRHPYRPGGSIISTPGEGIETCTDERERTRRGLPEARQPHHSTRRSTHDEPPPLGEEIGQTAEGRKTRRVGPRFRVGEFAGEVQRGHHTSRKLVRWIDHRGPSCSFQEASDRLRP